jgi:anti-sigma B factor antagonist
MQRTVRCARGRSLLFGGVPAAGVPPACLEQERPAGAVRAAPMTQDQQGDSPPLDEPRTRVITTSVTYRAEAVVLTVAGEIDVSTADELEVAIDAVLNHRPPAFIIDLSDVEFLASVGLRLLFAANEQAEIPGRFAVVADSPVTRKPIQLTDLDKIFALFSTLDDAVRSLKDNSPG